MAEAHRELDGDLLALSDRFMAALNVGDGDTVREVYAPDARIWHNFDDKFQTVEENIETMKWLHTRLKDIDYDVQRRVPTSDGFVQEHILRGTLPSGKPFALFACAVIRVENGRIAELREYLDTVQSRPLFERAA